MLTYVLNADNSPLMPCHPARARELVRKGRAYWVHRDTIKLKTYRDNAVLQKVTLGVDSGAEHIGIAAVAERAKHRPRVLFQAQIEARPMKEIKELMDERRSYRRGRRSRQQYRRPWFSPTRRVRLSAKLYDKDGNFLYKIPVSYGEKLTQPDRGGHSQARKIRGNKFQLLTGHQPGTPMRADKPGAKDILVYSVEGRLITWYDPARGDLKDIEKRFLGESRKHKHPIASIDMEAGRKVIRLLSKSAEHAIPKDALPNPMPPFRKFGQKRKPEGWLSPSAKSLKDAHIRGVQEVKKYIPVSLIRLEIAAFDIHKLADPEIKGVGYQEPAMYAGQNRKDFVITRDGWKCVYCGKSGLGKNSVPLTVDHVRPRHPRKGDGGSDSINNLVACCAKCQKEKGNLLLEEFLARKHKSEARRIKEYINSLDRRNSALYNAAHVGQIKTALIKELNVVPTWGYVTKRDRIYMHLPKGHNTDAIAIASWGKHISTNMPILRQFYVRRYAKGKASRRQQYKANPLALDKINAKGYAPAWVGKGRRYRLVQQIGVNKYAVLNNGEKIRLRDLVKTSDGRIGYVKKINSNGSITLSLIPVGRNGNFSASVGKIVEVLIRKRGLMEAVAN